ncbi:hypothetical protein F5887DRAFT_1075855 [Amanita rubescens]|nr:hypothetical protein F5887DRAFT_1075855 [Amanita rubescens]
MVAQLRTPSRCSPISDSSMSLSLLDAFPRTPSRSSCATRRGMTSSSQNASQKSPKIALNNWIGFRRRYTRFEWVISRKLAHTLRIWGYQPENIQPDGFIRMKYILALPTFRKYSVELIRKIVDLDRMKRFELRRELCRESGIREWSIRLARGELEIPIKEVDRGNKRITHLSRLPPEAQCTLALEDWPFSRRHGLSKRADNNLINLHPSQDNPFAIDYGPSGSVVVVDIDIHAAFYAGIAFYLAKNGDLVTSGDDNWCSTFSLL